MGTTAEKLAYLKETKNQIKQALETPSNVMRDYANWIKKYVDNQPIQVVTDGVCANALDVPLVSMGVDGQSEQKQYSGKNKLLNNAITRTAGGITFTVKSDKTIIVNGTATSLTQINIGKPIIGTYRYTGCPSGGNYSNGYRIRIRNSASPYTEYGDDIGNGIELTFSEVLDTDVITLTIDSGITVNNLIFKPMISKDGGDYEPYVGGQPSPNPDYPQDVEVIDGVNLFDGELELGNYDTNGNKTDSTTRIRCKNPIPVFKGKTYIISDNSSLSYSRNCLYDINHNFIKTVSSKAPFSPTEDGYYTFSIVSTDLTEKIQLNEGTTPKPYLPYGCIGLEQSGKNKFDNFKEYSYSNSNLNTTSLNNGIKIEKKGGFALWVFDNLENLDGKIVRAKSKFNDGGNITIGLASLDGTSRTVMKENNKSDTVSSFLIPKITDNKKYLAVWLYGSDNSEISYEDLIITIDNEDMTYEPYHKPKVIEINLNGNTLAKVGDAKDLLKIYRNGDVKISKKRNRYVFTGDEDLVSDLIGSKFTDGVYGVSLAISNMKSYDKFAYESNGIKAVMCNYFSVQRMYGKVMEAIDNGWGKNVYIKVLTSRINNPTTLQEALTNFKQWFKNKYNAGTPVYVDYELATPESIKLPSIEPIELWEGTNKFKLITNLDTTFEMEYVVNKDYIINTLETQNLLNIVEGENI